MSYGRGARRVRSLSHITEYHIPDSDFDDSDEQTGGRPNENIAASKASTVTAETNDGIRARNDYYGSPLGIVYDGRQDWTTLHIFLWGCGGTTLVVGLSGDRVQFTLVLFIVFIVEVRDLGASSLTAWPSRSLDTYGNGLCPLVAENCESSRAVGVMHAAILRDPMHLQPHAAAGLPIFTLLSSMSLESRPNRASHDERSLPQNRKQEDGDWKRALAKIRGIKEYTIPDSDFTNSHGEMVHRELRKLGGYERKAQKQLVARPEVKLEGIKDYINPSNSNLDSDGETKDPELTQDKQVKAEEGIGSGNPEEWCFVTASALPKRA
ncbi:hypothetical protein BKA70DRAFT_1233945 [Coprinopsis sp. MPI-PUGE-AT-0042]|nr:hypothetical protein BKA70DRAFT_1233945 [Coprinopsis sp. MPI-PUGE-AT-0042]